jgi:hypothetical protein
MIYQAKYKVGDKLTEIGTPLADYDTGSEREITEVLDDEDWGQPAYRLKGGGILLESELAPTDSPEAASARAYAEAAWQAEIAAEEAEYELGRLLGEY